MRYRPLGDRVLVELEVVDNTTAAGLILPDQAKDQPQKGKVLSIGAKVEEIKVGEVATFPPYTGIPFNVDGVEHLIIKEEDIVAIEEA